MIYALLMDAAVVCVSACWCFFKRQQIRIFLFYLFRVHLFSVGGEGGGELSINADLCRLAGWEWFGRKEPLRVKEWLLMGFYSWTRERVATSQCVFMCVCVCVFKTVSPGWLSSCWNNHLYSTLNLRRNFNTWSVFYDRNISCCFCINFFYFFYV